MKVQLHEDERYPYINIRTKADVREREAQSAEWYRKHHHKERPAEYNASDDSFHDVPDELAEELIALRKREEEILYDMELHIRRTGQRPVQEDWEPYAGDSV